MAVAEGIKAVFWNGSLKILGPKFWIRDGMEVGIAYKISQYLTQFFQLQIQACM